MACPYFCPTDPLPASTWPSKLRPPLGEPYAGVCRARQGEDFRPGEDFLIDVCNLGYPALTCTRFPSQAGPDAVRFSVMADDDRVVRIAYVLEKGHASYENGFLQYDRGANRWSSGKVQPLLQRQADAYLNSYLRHKQETRATKAKWSKASGSR